jgi:hypothetical protein
MPSPSGINGHEHSNQSKSYSFGELGSCTERTWELGEDNKSESVRSKNEGMRGFLVTETAHAKQDMGHLEKGKSSSATGRN